KLRGLLMRRAGLRWRAGSLGESARDYEEALELAHEHGETAGEAAALASLSVVHRDLGDPRVALRCGRAALRLLQDLDDPQAEAYVLYSLAESYASLGHHSSALSCLKRSLRLRRRIGDKDGEARILRDIAKVSGSPGNTDRTGKARTRPRRKRSAGRGS
ncbi:MAG: tetratricopeptide repeat protein, partial [Actinomycetota bacterium]